MENRQVEADSYNFLSLSFSTAKRVAALDTNVSGDFFIVVWAPKIAEKNSSKDLATLKLLSLNPLVQSLTHTKIDGIVENACSSPES
mmetsp:Transcript_30402/g.58063  ORF Transcript_30402/g.58063 Transcript_30402/m.58063 type:complete len:87 (-) Transcript_30402:1419-1679(-)